MRRIAALFALVCLAMGTPAGAFHDPPIPALATISFDGPHAVSFSFVVGAPAQMSWEIEATSDAGNAIGAGLWLLDENGAALDIFAGFASSGSTEVHAQTAPTGVILDSHEVGSGGGLGLALTIESLDPGTYTAVALAATGGAGPGSATLYGDDGVTLLGTAEGADAFLYQERDFDGLANADVDVQGTVKARAILQGEVSRTTADPVFGWFTAFSDPATVLAYDGPDGTHDGGNDYLISNAPAGDYTFHADGVGGPTFFSGLWLFGASVPMPAAPVE